MAFVLCLVCVSCQDDSTPNPNDGEMVEVTFNVNPFEIGVEPMDALASRSGGVPANESVSEINYYIIKNSNQKMWQGKQLLETDGDEFGTIKLWLPEGEYSINMVAFKPGGRSDLTWLERDKRLFFIVDDRDMFGVYNYPATISATSPTVDITLPRTTGKLVVNFTDERIDPEIKSIDIRGTVVNAIYPQSNELSSSSNFTQSLNVVNGHVDGWERFIIPQTNCSLTIGVVDEFGNELGTTNLKFNVYANRRTIISGKLMDVIQQRPLTITIDDEWGDDVNVPLK